VSIRQVRDAAAGARRELGLGDDSPLPDILALLEASGLRAFGHPLGVDGIDGAYEVVRDQPFILFNVEKVPQRIRFTLAHEYGHHVLGHGARPPEHVKAGDPSPVEREANIFASAFLMPEAGISRWFDAHGRPSVDLDTVTRIAAAFGVSAWAMRYCLQNLRYLRSDTAIKKLEEQMNAGAHTRLAKEAAIPLLRDTVSEAHRVGLWLPVDHQRTLLTLLEEGRASEETIERQLPEGTGLDDLRALAAQYADEADADG
jgi:Zn-dependent peptidase ImmA (M78 family)